MSTFAGMKGAFVLGSTSVLKTEAMRTAMNRAGFVGFTFETADVSSGVDAQPIGLDMAALGAENRANAARERDRTPIGIGIESGLTLVRGVWIDTATVAITKHGVLVALSVSAGLAFPYDCVMEAIAAGVRSHTAGEFIAKKLGGNATDPHSTLTKGRVTRQALIADAVYAALIGL